jgi:5-(carboxyamino)imidazole ribonucleotide synthase
MRIGIFGAGQLGRMLALAGHPLGLEFVFFDPATDACAAAVGRHIRADYIDTVALRDFARQIDVATTEFENVPADALRAISDIVPVYPPADAIATTQDRLLEKQLFQRLGIATPDFAAIDSQQALHDFATRGPCIVKTRRFGYDGKGQARVKMLADVDSAWSALGGANLIGEGWVQFDREVSIIAVRGHNGEIVFYPIAENQHRDGILAVSYSRPGDAIQAKAEDYARRILETLNYVGAMGIEFFQRGNDLLANEIAPRVHNTGHWTIEGAVTSQFENHLRAILGLPLGSTAARGYSVMINCIGQLPDTDAVLKIPGAHLHLYGKAPKPGRKVAHITYCSDNPADIETAIPRLTA